MGHYHGSDDVLHCLGKLETLSRWIWPQASVSMMQFSPHWPLMTPINPAVPVLASSHVKLVVHLREIAEELDAQRTIRWTAGDGTNIADLMRSAADEIELFSRGIIKVVA